MALVLIGLAGWWFAATPGTRGTPARPSTAPASARATPEEPEPAPLQPATAPTRSDLPAEPERPPVAASARLVVRIARTEATLASAVKVTLVQQGGRSASEFSVAPDASGLELPCAPGDVSLRARSDGPPRLVSLAVHATLQPGASELVELVLAPEAVLGGTLEDETGRPLEGLEVSLRRRKESLGRARSDAGGRFLLEPLPAGEYELVLGDPDGPLRPPETLTLAPGDPPRTIVLPVLLALGLRVVDAEGAPVAGVRLEGTGKPGGRLQGVTDDDGRLRVEGLPPGDYRLFARHATLGRATHALALDARTSATELELVLRR